MSDSTNSSNIEIGISVIGADLAVSKLNEVADSEKTVATVNSSASVTEANITRAAAEQTAVVSSKAAQGAAAAAEATAEATAEAANNVTNEKANERLIKQLAVFNGLRHEMHLGEAAAGALGMTMGGPLMLAIAAFSAILPFVIDGAKELFSSFSDGEEKVKKSKEEVDKFTTSIGKANKAELSELIDSTNREFEAVKLLNAEYTGLKAAMEEHSKVALDNAEKEATAEIKLAAALGIHVNAVHELEAAADRAAARRANEEATKEQLAARAAQQEQKNVTDLINEQKKLQANYDAQYDQIKWLKNEMDVYTSAIQKNVAALDAQSKMSRPVFNGRDVGEKELQAFDDNKRQVQAEASIIPQMMAKVDNFKTMLEPLIAQAEQTKGKLEDITAKVNKAAEDSTKSAQEADQKVDDLRASLATNDIGAKLDLAVAEQKQNATEVSAGLETLSTTNAGAQNVINAVKAEVESGVTSTQALMKTHTDLTVMTGMIQTGLIKTQDNATKTLQFFAQHDRQISAINAQLDQLMRQSNQAHQSNPNQ